MKRDDFIRGFSGHKGIKKARMVKDYTEIANHIEAMEDDAQEDIDWDYREDEAVEMFDFFYDRYTPDIGSKHKGRAVIRKHLSTHKGRQQLVRVMREQIKRFADE